MNSCSKVVLIIAGAHQGPIANKPKCIHEQELQTCEKLCFLNHD